MGVGGGWECGEGVRKMSVRSAGAITYKALTKLDNISLKTYNSVLKAS
jgi:hypothetical protein